MVRDKQKGKHIQRGLGRGLFLNFGNVLVLIFASLTINLFSLAVPIVTLQVYDRILRYKSIDTLQVLCAGVLVIAVLDALLKFSRSSLIGWASARFEHLAYTQSVRHIMSANLRDIKKFSAGEQLQRLGAISKLKSFRSGQSLINLIDLPFVAIFLAFIGYLAGVLLFVPLVLLTLFGIFAIYTGYRTRKALLRRDHDDDQRINFVSESLEKIHTVKMLGLEQATLRRHEQVHRKNVYDAYTINTINAQTSNAAALFTQVMMISMVSLGALMVVDGQITMGILIACVLLSGRIMQPLHRTLSFWTSMQEYQLAQRKVDELLAVPNQERAAKTSSGRPRGHLEIKNLQFSYGGEKGPLLFKGFNLNLAPGKTIALSGPPGDGKSTLLKLIAGFYKPTSGQLLIDGKESCSYLRDELVTHVGYLPSEAEIFQGTIMDNLTGFRNELHEQAEIMANYLGIDKVVSKLPHGYNTVLVDSQSDLLTPGMKQRITIARVLINRPRLILFDFADKSLDKDGYNHVFRLLGKLRGQVSMILGSNDRNVIHLAQEEYVIENGILISKDQSKYSNSNNTKQRLKELRA
ncbi:MAG: peptidase domain-containing ABC transporter [Methyloligellaceae bacterium]